ncbi:uncharacterized protein LOC124814246 isoform X2 [Hydra vulgaris]|uniref:uncharacterized protein LOC124814246 isoform X2 n=1 Tax=Hydra vulgaris TaxID=6087 RepID=UPI001F5EF1C7|nr:uncharacterized protein LOC124814246 isoform X2 [Hydra vulgaris]
MSYKLTQHHNYIVWYLEHILQNEINRFLPLENVSTCNNEVDIYTPFQMQHRIVSKILEVLNANASSGKVYTIKNIEVKSTIVIVTNIPTEVHAGYMDEFMVPFGRLLTKFQHVKVEKKNLRYGWIVYEDLRSAEKCINFINEKSHHVFFMKAMLLPEDFTSEACLFNLKTIQVEGFPKDFTKKKIRSFLRDISPDRRNVPLKFVMIKKIEAEQTYHRVPNMVFINFDTPRKAIEIFFLLDNCVFPYNQLELVKFKAYFALPYQFDFGNNKQDARLGEDIEERSKKSNHTKNNQFLQSFQPSIFELQKINYIDQSFFHRQSFHTLPFIIRPELCPALTYPLLPAFAPQNTFSNLNQNRLHGNQLQKIQYQNFQQCPFIYPLSASPMYPNNFKENVLNVASDYLVQKKFVELQTFNPLQHTAVFPTPETMYIQNDLFYIPQEKYILQNKFSYPSSELDQEKQNDEQISQKYVQQNTEHQKENDFLIYQNVGNSNSSDLQSCDKNFGSDNKTDVTDNAPIILQDVNKTKTNLLYQECHISSEENIAFSNQQNISWENGKKSSKRWSKRKKVDKKQKDINGSHLSPQSTIDVKMQLVKIQQNSMLNKIDKLGTEIKIYEKLKKFNDIKYYKNQSHPNSVVDIEKSTFESDKTAESVAVVVRDPIIKNDNIKKYNKLCKGNVVDNAMQTSISLKTYNVKQSTFNSGNADNKEIYKYENEKCDQTIVFDTNSKSHQQSQPKENMPNKEDMLSSLLKMSILDSNFEEEISIQKSHPLDIKLDDNIKNSRLLSFMKGICYQRFCPNKMINRLF